MHYAHKIGPGDKVNLKDFNPSETRGLDREIAEATTQKLGEELEELQALMYEASQTSLLIVLQGRDTSGKDGSIRSLVHHMNAQSCRVASFKVPTELEQGHDFLWRVHAQTPQTGFVTIFNRSHYEDVLVTRVHKLISKDTCKVRYDHINAFERLLVDSKTLILKFYLHISKEEQESRLLDRQKETEKAWKLSVGDWKERELWGDYTKAYEDALSKCSTPDAPWFVVPANHKWYRNLAIMERVVDTLKPHKKDWIERLRDIGKIRKEELAEYQRQLAERTPSKQA